jgi:hypothetical protein
MTEELKTEIDQKLGQIATLERATLRIMVTLQRMGLSFDISELIEEIGGLLEIIQLGKTNPEEATKKLQLFSQIRKAKRKKNRK